MKSLFFICIYAAIPKIWWMQESCPMSCDHRRSKRLVKPGFGFGSFHTVRRTLKGYEVMAMLRQGQIQNVDREDVTGQFLRWIEFEAKTQTLVLAQIQLQCLVD